MGVKNEFTAAELWWTVPFAFSVGLLAGWGLFSAPEASVVQSKTTLEWGSVGEWAGGIGALAAALVALWLGLRELRERRRVDTTRSALLASAVVDEVGSLIEALSAAGAQLSELPKSERRHEGIHLQRLRFSYRRLLTPVLDQHRAEFFILPSRLGEKLAGLHLQIRDWREQLRKWLQAYERQRKDVPSLEAVERAAKEAGSICDRFEANLLELRRLALQANV